MMGAAAEVLAAVPRPSTYRERSNVTQLEGRLTTFVPLYHWLEYWGNWCHDNGALGMNWLARVQKYGDTYLPRSTGNDGFPDDIAVLEKGLSTLRLQNRFQFHVLYAMHVYKFSFLEIGAAFRIRRRGVERTLYGAYVTVERRVNDLDPIMLSRPAGFYVAS